MPGAEKDQVVRAMQLADRVSINLEAPNTERLAALAPRKQFIEELIQPLKWVENSPILPPNKNGKVAGPQLPNCRGGGRKKDLELLSTTHHLYHE
jgi:predicted DNA-binding helix-hairpin-helix protein